jgi:hypothetical protein
MKLEFLPTGSADCPLIRLYDFRPAEVANLATAICGLAEGLTTTCPVHELMGVEPVNGCRFVLRAGHRDRGMVRLPGSGNFECVLTTDSWANVAGLTEPFVAGRSGFQWLSTGGDARWLLSRDGQW